MIKDYLINTRNKLTGVDIINNEINSIKEKIEKNNNTTEIQQILDKINTIENSNKINNYFYYQNNYRNILERKKNKLKNKNKLIVYFYVIYDSTFSENLIFEKMCKDKYFDPYIIVIPDILRGHEHMVRNLNKTYDSLSKKYKKILLSYDKKNNKFVDFTSKADIIFYSCPYKGMTHELYEIDNSIHYDVLSCYISYAFLVHKIHGIHIMNYDSYNLFWKIFVDSDENSLEFIKYQPIKGLNTIITGFPKLDKLPKLKFRKNKLKTIIIAPHHTVNTNPLINLSNFIKYSNLFLELPKLYKNINFIFRPHPLLIAALYQNNSWGKEKTDKYIKKITSFPNVKYSTEGNYLEIFANSDAIIHDCGSFLIEYIYTGKPMLYLLKNKNQIVDEFFPLAQKTFNHVYKAYRKQDILKFIDNVVIKESDPLKKERKEFSDKVLKKYYPKASQNIFNYIKKELINE